MALTPPKEEDEKPKIQSKVSTPEGEEEQHLASLEEHEDHSTELKEDLNDGLQSVDIEAPKESDDHLSSAIEESPRPTTFKEKLLKIWNGDRAKRFKFILKQTINGPVIALTLGTIIGLIPPVKQFLITDPPLVVSAFVHTLSLFAR